MSYSFGMHLSRTLPFRPVLFQDPLAFGQEISVRHLFADLSFLHQNRHSKTKVTAKFAVDSAR
jgi:hypothetical protein